MSHARRSIINIGPGEQRKRYLLGCGLMALSIALIAFLSSISSPLWWRLGVFVPLWGGILGLLQAHHKT